MKEIIFEQMSAKFDSKEEFSNHLGIDPKNLASKLQTVQKRIDWLNEFLKPLELEVDIVSTQVKPRLTFQERIAELKARREKELGTND